MEHVKSGLRNFRNFVLEISHGTMSHGKVDQLKLIAIKSRNLSRIINALPHGRQLTYSKYPNQ